MNNEFSYFSGNITSALIIEFLAQENRPAKAERLFVD